MRARLAILLLLLAAAPARGHELSGYLAAEGRVFFESPRFAGQRHNNGSLILAPEYYHELADGAGLTVSPFLRIDSADGKRSHFDLRELSWLWPHDTWELQLGVSKVFWGATEFVHLTDIVNQTDLVEAIDGEEKLGQPMARLALAGNWGAVDLFVLPWFRERTFAGRRGRLRAGPVVDTANARYENSDRRHHLDFAVRYSRTLGAADVGISHFTGTGREPTLMKVLSPAGEPELVPFYPQINQTGLDLQLAAGQWLWKLETIHRTGQGDGFSAAAGGLEYTVTRVAATAADLGVIVELAYDERGARATTPFDNDIMFGLRLAANDAASTELLAGCLHDLKTPAAIFTLEASRRLGANWKATLEGYLFQDQPEDDLLFSLRRDDYLSLVLARYF